MSSPPPTLETDPDIDNDASLYAILNVPRDATPEEIRKSYRQLAATLHPDKAPTPDLQQAASQQFTRLQEAYETLSDPTRRDIYDVYGAEGLAAGMELSGPFSSREDLRKEWAAFREKQRKESLEASLNYRGTYVFRTDATALINPYNKYVSRTPQLTNVYMMNGLDIPIESSKHWGILASEQDVLHIGGLVSVRDSLGGGSFIAGYRRVYSDYTQVGVEASVGLRTLLSAQTSFQLSQNSSATLVASWNPRAGAGLQFITTRQLNDSTSGEFSWTLGPPDARGMALSVTHRREKWLLLGKIEVGVMTALVLRVVRSITEAITARFQVKLGFSGVEVDVGTSHRVSENSVAGISVVVGMQGVMLRARMSRAGHTFEFPVVLSTTLVPRVIVMAYFGPPLAWYILKEWVVEPVKKSVEARRALTERTKRAEEIKEEVKKAVDAAALMEPVAKRRVKREAVASGLVVVLALYGEKESVMNEEETKRRLKAKVEKNDLLGAEEIEGEIDNNNLLGAENQDNSNSTELQPESSSSDNKQIHVEEQAIEEMPPPFIDVTTAVQYLCDSGKIIFHDGYSKSSLMGFCDPSPSSTEKVLVVYFTYQGRPCRAVFGDVDGGVLPARGEAVEDSEEALIILNIAHAIGLSR